MAALVPCGYDKNGNGKIDPEEECKLCDLFVLLDNVIDFFLKIVLLVSILLLVIGGFMFLFYAEDPQMVEQGKRILTSVAVGLAIIFSAYLVIGAFLKMIGLAEWTENIYQNWWNQGFFQIPCPSVGTTPGPSAEPTPGASVPSGAGCPPCICNVCSAVNPCQ
jgi:hypothetical protein